MKKKKNYLPAPYGPNQRYRFTLSKATALNDKRARGRPTLPLCFHTNPLFLPSANVSSITGKSYSTDHYGNSHQVKFSFGQNELSYRWWYLRYRMRTRCVRGQLIRRKEQPKGEDFPRGQNNWKDTRVFYPRRLYSWSPFARVPFRL